MAQRPLHRNVSNLKDKAVPVIRGLKESLNSLDYDLAGKLKQMLNKLQKVTENVRLDNKSDRAAVESMRAKVYLMSEKIEIVNYNLECTGVEIRKTQKEMDKKIQQILNKYGVYIYEESNEERIFELSEREKQDDFWVALHDESIEDVKSLYNNIKHRERPESGGESPLHIASQKGDLEIVKFLVENGAQINATDYYFNATPLLDAVLKGQYPVVEYLLKNGAHVNHQDLFLETALHKAVCYHHRHIIELLLEHGADRSLRDCFGQTPIEAARILYSKSLPNYILPLHPNISMAELE